MNGYVLMAADRGPLASYGIRGGEIQTCLKLRVGERFWARNQRKL